MASEASHIQRVASEASHIPCVASEASHIPVWRAKRATPLVYSFTPTPAGGWVEGVGGNSSSLGSLGRSCRKAGRPRLAGLHFFARLLWRACRKAARHSSRANRFFSSLLTHASRCCRLPLLGSPSGLPSKGKTATAHTLFSALLAPSSRCCRLPSWACPSGHAQEGKTTTALTLKANNE